MSRSQVGEEIQRTYLRKLADSLGVKGVILLIALPVAPALAATYPDTFTATVLGAVLVVALAAAVVHSLLSGSNIDAVGVSFVVVAVAYTVVVALGAVVTWWLALAAFFVVLAAVVYDYLFPDEFDLERWSEGEGSITRIDVVGFVVSEVLLVYSILLFGGWVEFAHSATFGAIVFVVYAATTSVFAGYSVVAREVEVAYVDDQIYDLLIGVIREIRDVSDDDVRASIASKMRLVAEELDGVELPTEIEDRYGEVPIVLPTHSPTASQSGVTTSDVVASADETDFTGYAVHGDAIILFRNGAMFKYYHDGDFGYEADELRDATDDVAFHELTYSSLNEIDDLTPRRDIVVTPEEAEEEREAEREPSGDRVLEVGGDEIDMDEMFEKADEVIESLSDRP